MSNQDPPTGAHRRGFDASEVERLRQMITHYERLLAAIPDFVSVVGRDFVYRDVNRAYLEAYLKRREGIVGHTVAELLGQERFETLSRPRLERCFRGEHTLYQAWFELPNGGRRFMNVSYTPYLEPDGSISGAVVSARDITELHQVQEALRQSEERYRTLAEASLDDIFVLDRERRISYVNASAARRFGRPAEEVVGQHLEGLFPPPVAARLLSSVGEAFATESPLYRESPVVFPGRAFWLGTWLIPFLRNPQGRLESVLGISRDITERRTMEEALRKSEERFRSLVENTSDWVWEVDAAGVFTYCSPASQHLLGRAPEELLGHTCFELMPEPDAQRVREALRPMVRVRMPFAGLEHPVLGPGGRLLTMETGGVPVLDAQGALLGYRGISRDVSERKLIEAELRQAQKMEALGRLAGGVAHDFNNLLNVIVGYSDLLLRRLPRAGEAWGQLEQIQKAAEQATGLTRQLLAFSRRRSQSAEDLNLNAVVAELERMLRRLIGEDVELELSLGADLARVHADRSQLEQVILNLAVNARDAMPAGGRLGIETKDGGADTLGVPAVVLTVTDTGQGMDAETQARIFEPFFTKEEGTGLGLSTAFGIVRRAGGELRVSSQPGRGTHFEVFLPAASEKAAPRPAPESSRSVLTGQETVLVVEDQEMARNLVREMLSLLGYQVLTAANGRQALDLASAHSGPIHLLLTDVVMPGLSGPETAEHLRVVRPDTRVLFMSGYSDDRIAGYGVLESGAPLLDKPFTSDTLARAVRQVLSAPPRPLG